jgi:flagellar FliJ protein
MAKEMKPGKKFKYSLESVLKVKAIREKKEQEKFALRQKEYYDEKMKEQRIQDEKKEQANEFKKLVAKGAIPDFGNVLSRRQHLIVLKEALDTQIEKVIDSSHKLEKQREKLLDSMKERKIIEKDKENKKEQYDEVMKQYEIKFLDEVATLRFSRDKEKVI